MSQMRIAWSSVTSSGSLTMPTFASGIRAPLGLEALERASLLRPAVERGARERAVGFALSHWA